MIKTYLGWAAATLCGLAIAGCGEETQNGIARSPYAPTQAQLDELNRQVVQQYARPAGKHANGRAHRAARHG